jgi:hypothetical protein
MCLIVQWAIGVSVDQGMVEGYERGDVPLVGAVFELPVCAAVALSLPVDDAEWESLAGDDAETGWVLGVTWVVGGAEEPGFLDEVCEEVFVLGGGEFESAAFDDCGAIGFCVADVMECQHSVQHEVWQGAVGMVGL